MNRLVFHIFIALLTFPNGYVIIKKTVRKRLRYMLEVKFYEKAEDSLLKFAVILPRQTENGSSANIKIGRHGRYPADTGKPVKPFMTRLSES